MRTRTDVDLLAQLGRIERAYEDKVTEVGWLDSRVSELEMELQTREIEITGLEAELRNLSAGAP